MIGLSARVSRPRARLIVTSGRLEVIDEGPREALIRVLRRGRLTSRCPQSSEQDRRARFGTPIVDRPAGSATSLVAAADARPGSGSGRLFPRLHQG